MAKKKPRKPPDKPVAAIRATEGASAAKGLKRDTTALSDREKAQIWTLKEEGHSWRSIAKQTGRSLNTVGRVLAEDISRLESLVRAQKEERARLFEQIENKGLKSLDAWIAEAHKSVFTPSGRLKRSWQEKDERLLKHAPRMISALRMAADTATKQSQLLTGAPTERYAGAGPASERRSAAEELVGEPELVAEAVRLGMKKDLPPAVVERYAQLITQVEAEFKDRPGLP